MLFKYFIGCLLAFGLNMPVFSSPALQEQQVGCKMVAENAHSGAMQREKLTKDQLMATLMSYFERLAINVYSGLMTEQQVVELVEAVLEGYESKKSPDAIAGKVFEGCMNRKNI